MSKLTARQAKYHAAQERVAVLRAEFIDELRVQRAKPRTFDDIGREVGLSRSRVLRLIEEK